MRIIPVILLALAYSPGLHAQNEADIRRFSSNYHFGTARHSALGGAMGALGGDLSAVFTNPASIAVFRFSEVGMSAGMELNSIQSTFLDNTSTSSTSRVVVNNAGLVLANETRNPYWKSFNVGISYNRFNTFNDELNLTGLVDYEQSLVRDFVQEANGFFPDELSPISARLAWEAFVIDNPDSSSNYVGEYIEGDRIRQTLSSSRNGRMGETAITFGGNYNDVFYVGGSLNFQSIRYESLTSTTEALVFPEGVSALSSYTYNEELLLDGLGVNLRLGFIAKAGDYIRIGCSVTTPTTFSITEEYSYSINANWTPALIGNPFFQDGFFEYRLRTPWRYMASVAGFIGKKGFISAQYEYANIAAGELREQNGSGQQAFFDQSNAIAAEFFTGSNTLRIGAEYRAAKQLFLRAGFAHFNNTIPDLDQFANGANLNRLQYSGGLGYRKALWSLDASYTLSRFDELYQVVSGGPIATLENKLGLITVSFSYRL